MSYRILSDNDCHNSPGLCNNPSCPNPPIYWNPQVVHSRTGRQIPLSEPFNPQVKAPLPHQCMRQHRPGIYINKYEGYESAGRNQDQKQPPPPWPLPLPEGVHPGTTHLWVNNEFVRLYKCPLCSFQNIHRDVINHHLKFAYDKYHNESGIRI